MAAVGSFVAGTIGAVLISVAAPVTANFAKTFGPPEYFLIVMAGPLTVIVILRGDGLLGALSALIDFAIGTVGVDIGIFERYYIPSEPSSWSDSGSTSSLWPSDCSPLAKSCTPSGAVAISRNWTSSACPAQKPRFLAQSQGLPPVGILETHLARLLPRVRSRTHAWRGCDRRLADGLQRGEVRLPHAVEVR